MSEDTSIIKSMMHLFLKMMKRSKKSPTNLLMKNKKKEELIKKKIVHRLQIIHNQGTLIDYPKFAKMKFFTQKFQWRFVSIVIIKQFYETKNPLLHDHSRFLHFKIYSRYD